MTADPYFGQSSDEGLIEHAYPPEELVEGIDYVWDDVMQSDGSTRRVLIRRPRP